MKTNFFKTTPLALAAVLGLSGAFLTTSMQSAPKDDAYKQGWIDSDLQPCDVPVDCQTDANGFICEADGQTAHGKDNNCLETLYRYIP